MPRPHYLDEGFRKPVNLSELNRLESLCRTKHPNWTVDRGASQDGGIVELYYGAARICDAICHSGSYGGDEGLLEFWTGRLSDDPQGYLSAEEALALFEKRMDERTGRAKRSPKTLEEK